MKPESKRLSPDIFIPQPYIPSLPSPIAPAAHDPPGRWVPGQVRRRVAPPAAVCKGQSCPVPPACEVGYRPAYPVFPPGRSGRPAILCLRRLPPAARSAPATHSRPTHSAPPGRVISTISPLPIASPVNSSFHSGTPKTQEPGVCPGSWSTSSRMPPASKLSPSRKKRTPLHRQGRHAKTVAQWL